MLIIITSKSLWKISNTVLIASSPCHSSGCRGEGSHLFPWDIEMRQANIEQHKIFCIFENILQSAISNEMVNFLTTHLRISFYRTSCPRRLCHLSISFSGHWNQKFPALLPSSRHRNDVHKYMHSLHFDGALTKAYHNICCTSCEQRRNRPTSLFISMTNHLHFTFKVTNSG